ncbi:hypothetical protein CEXT_21581 [Caerostris extrusa]|uniref:Uncharacterized protein n=1 Tax=Caerostris extrusa TaxID=172846 RepID=A0AAV4NM37_CAEEX|nr:hypothetical protein CEXT_21581 [Caerostris extrusa]
MPCIPSEGGLAYRAASLNGAEKWAERDLLSKDCVLVPAGDSLPLAAAAEGNISCFLRWFHRFRRFHRFSGNKPFFCNLASV